MEKRTFFRIANNTTEQGLWYDFIGTHQINYIRFNFKRS